MFNPTLRYTTSNANLARTPVYRATFARSYPKTVLADHPVLYLRFGEASGATVAVDASGNGLDGTYQNSPALGVTGSITGDTDTALLLNGVDQYVTVADDPLLDLGGDVFTIKIRVKRTANTGAEQYFFTKGNNGYALLHTDGIVSLLKDGVAYIASSTVALPVGVWVDVVCTKSGAAVKIYFDAVDVTGVVTNQTIAATATDLNIGRYSGGAAYFAGALDELSLYATALTPARIRDHYHAGRGGKFSTDKICDYLTEVLADGPSGYYRLNETTGTAAADSSGNLRHGTHVNTPTLGVAGLLTGSSDKAVAYTSTNGEYTDLPSAAFDPTGVKPWSMEVWINPGAVTGTLYIIMARHHAAPSRSGPLTLINTDSKVYTERWIAGAQTSVAISTSVLVVGTRYHIAVTYDGANLRLYINGALEATGGTDTAVMPALTDTPKLGSAAFPVFYYDGIQDEAGFYPACLSAARVLAHYNAGKRGQYLTDWKPYLELPRSIAAFVEPEHGRSSTGAIVLPITDVNGDFTSFISGDGIGQDVVTFEAGFDDIQGEEFQEFAKGIVEGCRMTANHGGYEVTIRDPQTLTNKQVFNVAASKLTYPMTTGHTTLYLADASEYEDSGDLRIENELASYTGQTDGSPISTAQLDTAYGGGAWVSVGTNDCWHSEDGKNWHSGVIPAGTYLSVCWAAALGLFVAVGTAGVIATSTDGRVWTAQTAAAANTLACVCWNEDDGILVAVSTDGANRVQWSTDAVTWNDETAAAANPWASVCWASGLSGGAKFVAVAPTGASRVMHSPDAITWTSATAAAAKPWGCIGYNGTMLVVLAVDTVSGTNLVMTSTNATAWTSQSCQPGQWRRIRYVSALSRWIAVGAGGVLAAAMQYSSDAITWTYGVQGSSWPSAIGGCYGVAWSDDHSLAAVACELIGNQPPIASIWSTDLMTFEATFSSLTGLTRGVDIGTSVSVAAAHAAGVSVGEVLRFTGHPLAIAYGWLTDSGKRGASIDPLLVNTAALALLKIAIGVDVQMDFLIDKAANLKTALETEINAPLGLYPSTSGTWSLTRIAGPGVAVATISHSNIVTPKDSPPLIGFDRNYQSVLNVISFDYDYDVITGKFLSTGKEYVNQDSIDKYGRKPLPPIQSKGLKGTLPGTADLLQTIADNLLERYARGSPLVPVRVFLQENLIEPGDIVSVTSALLPDPDTGVRGVTGALMEVVEREMVFAEGHVNLKLQWTGY